MSHRVSIDKIEEDDRLQMRAGYSDETVEDYRRVLAEHSESQSDDWPFATPVTLFRVGETDDRYLLVDGFHRLKAIRASGCNWVAAEIRTGTFDDALLHAIGANQQHGLQRSRQDKQKAVRAALTHPETSSKSDREIARLCGVSHPTVAVVRRELQPVENLPPASVTMPRTADDVSQPLLISPVPQSAQAGPEVEFDETSVSRTFTKADAARFRNAYGVIIRMLDYAHDPLDQISKQNSLELVEAFKSLGNRWEQLLPDQKWI